MMDLGKKNLGLGHRQPVEPDTTCAIDVANRS